MAEASVDYGRLLGPIPSLTGLRFIAASCVALTHGALLVVRFPGNPPLLYYLFTQISGMGMTLFFVLSGFVIHYNYSAPIRQQPSRSILNFFAARFARLYPLYCILLIYDLFRRFANGDFSGLITPGVSLSEPVVRALPWYISMMQSWAYKVIGNNNLLYQFGSVPQISWSISTEWFLYITYPAILFVMIPLKGGRAILGTTIVLAMLAFGGLTIAFFYSVEINNYAVAAFGRVADMGSHWQDSYFRWLIYFSPYSRVSEFILGCLTAAAYMRCRAAPPSPSEERAGMVTLCGSVLGLAALNYILFAPPQHFVWYHMSFGFAPLVAVLIFCCARYTNSIVGILSSGLFVVAGEASYSLYLLHVLVFVPLARHIGPVNSQLAEIHAFSWLAVAFLGCVGVSLVTYTIYEVPARRLLRSWLMVRSIGDPGPRWHVVPWATVAIILFFLPLSLFAREIGP
jgi:peptidoglycan/LPS O-acetylase OafA/YrhL